MEAPKPVVIRRARRVKRRPRGTTKREASKFASSKKMASVPATVMRAHISLDSSQVTKSMVRDPELDVDRHPKPPPKSMTTEESRKWESRIDASTVDAKTHRQQFCHGSSQVSTAMVRDPELDVDRHPKPPPKSMTTEESRKWESRIDASTVDAKTHRQQFCHGSAQVSSAMVRDPELDVDRHPKPPPKSMTTEESRKWESRIDASTVDAKTHRQQFCHGSSQVSSAMVRPPSPDKALSPQRRARGTSEAEAKKWAQRMARSALPAKASKQRFAFNSTSVHSALLQPVVVYDDDPNPSAADVPPSVDTSVDTTSKPPVSRTPSSKARAAAMKGSINRSNFGPHPLDPSPIRAAGVSASAAYAPPPVPSAKDLRQERSYKSHWKMEDMAAASRVVKAPRPPTAPSSASNAGANEERKERDAFPVKPTSVPFTPVSQGSRGSRRSTTRARVKSLNGSDIFATDRDLASRASHSDSMSMSRRSVASSVSSFRSTTSSKVADTLTARSRSQQHLATTFTLG